MALSKIVRDSLNTGIDDNSDATAITIDSSERVGVSTTAMAANLEVGSASSKINALTVKTATGSGGVAGISFMAGQTTAGREKAAIFFKETNGGAHYTGDLVFAIATSSGSATQVAASDEVCRITSGGLAIGGTGTANTLDDYEEGTWTPTIGGSSGTGTVSYSTQLGTYTKIGRVVTFHGQVTASSTVSGGSGTLQIAGLPFAASASPMNWYANANLSYFSGLNSYGTETDFVLLLGPTAGSTFVRFHAFVNRGDISRSPTQAQILSGSSFYFGGSYETTL